MREIGDMMIEEAGRGSQDQEQELEEIRAYVAAHREELEMRVGPPVVVAVPLAEVVDSERRNS